MVAALAEGLPIFYNSIVSRIQYAEDGVMVQAGGRSFRGNPPPPFLPAFIVNHWRLNMLQLLLANAKQELGENFVHYFVFPYFCVYVDNFYCL